MNTDKYWIGKKWSTHEWYTSLVRDDDSVRKVRTGNGGKHH